METYLEPQVGAVPKVGITPDAVNAAYANLAAAKQAYYFAAEAANTARRQYAEEYAAWLLRTGEAAGKNDGERKARFLEAAPDPAAEVEKAETTERRAKLDADLAGLEVERVRTLLRVMEFWN